MKAISLIMCPPSRAHRQRAGVVIFGPMVELKTTNSDRVHFGMIYDFRNPPQWRVPWTDFYSSVLEQVAWIDSDLLIDGVYLAEHHFVGDGGMPAVNAVVGALAARTRRLGLGANLIQLPLHHPLRIAEDALALDALSGGRYRLGVGNGYREVEFQALGVPMSQRRSRVEEAIAILRLAFAGEPFSFSGRHWEFPEIMVTPPPIRPGGPEIWLGGLVAAAVRRAGRIADGFLGMSVEGIHDYLAECERNALPEPRRQACMTYWAIVTEDPERAIAEVGPHFMYQVHDYIDYGFLGDVPHYTDPQKIVDDGVYRVLDADSAVREFTAAVAAGAQEIQFLPVMPGESFDRAAERLQYLSDHVIPRVHAAGGAPA
jgi:alkanesulfonate monooxygenase SsuD/methylene tetrahydromethanopterin reductase-like flavin-dependent oxidoreductase (luciferase family)